MPRYAAFLRGVSPMNCSMPGLKAALEAAGFGEVRTVLSSGNAVFEARAAPVAKLEQAVEAALLAGLKRPFPTMVRSIDDLRALLASDPYAGARVAKGAKRVVSFLRGKAKPATPLPLEQDGARVLTVVGTEAFSAYVPSERGPVFMALIERAFGKDVTTRTWETLEKVVRAGS